jgi:5'-3' exonuclease
VTKTLLVDANNLLKIGFYGVKEFYHKGEHIGGIYHFLNTLRKFIEEQNFDKVVVMWDGDSNSSARKLIYPKYKEQRTSTETDQKKESFYRQKERIKQYLEEMFVRQIEVNNNEADDLISYYCQIAENEQITIFSGDRDLTQLISGKVSVYSPNAKKTYKMGDMIKNKELEFPHYNIKTIKILCGDTSDNIDGIRLLGEKTLVKLFPEILENPISFNDILSKAETLLKEDKENVALKNLLTGKTKDGIYGEEYFQINEKIIDLSNPLITDNAKQIVQDYYKETLDPDGRGYKNLIRMMMEDGLFKYLPKNDNAWVEFLRPILKLTRKEKIKFKNQKNKL